MGTLVAMARNCKTARVLWCAQCIANMSAYPRSRAALAKESKLLPCLSAIMRYGCVEAERVQHFWWVARSPVTNKYCWDEVPLMHL